METIRRTKIVDVLKSDAFGTVVNVKGWVRTRRGSKQVNFIALNDGSTIHNVQVVVDVDKFSEDVLKLITTGASMSVNGVLVQSQGKGQQVEIQANEIEIYGTADPATYPLQKKGHSLEFLREIAHLRPRTNTFGAIFRIRHNMAYAIHKCFHHKISVASCYRHRNGVSPYPRILCRRQITAGLGPAFVQTVNVRFFCM